MPPWRATSSAGMVRLHQPPDTMHTTQLASPSRLIIVAALAALGPLGITGCQTRGYEKAAATSGSAQNAAAEIESTQQQLARVTATLDQLTAPSNEDLRPIYQRYRSEVAALQSSLESLEKRANALDEKKRAYFTAWDARTAEIQNADLRRQSADRRSDVSAQFDVVQRSYADARAKLAPLLHELTDVQRLLGVDLTAPGARSAASAVPRVRALADAARESLGLLARDYRQVSASLAPESL